MYEFLGAVTGRSIMKQGELNQDALLGALIGAIAMTSVSWYTQEDVQIYLFVFVKFSAFWLLSSISLGILSIIINYIVGDEYTACSNPKTAAWPKGPHLHPILQATREFISGIFSVFFPLNEQVELALRHVDLHRIGFTLGAAFIILILFGYLEDRRFNKL